MWSLINHETNNSTELRKVFVKTLQELMDENPNIIALDADLGGASGFKAISQSHPAQFINAGISEANMIGVAAGLSMRGFVPFVHSFAPFVSRRVGDQIYLEGAYAHNTINIFASDPGICSAQNGGTHTTFEDMAFLRAIPQVKVFHPADGVQLSWLIRELSPMHGVHYIRANRKDVPDIYEAGSKFEIGKGNILKRGSQVMLVSMGELLKTALDAAWELENIGVSVEVIDMFTVKPLDKKLIIEELRGKAMVVTLENHNIIGGLGGAVAEVMAEQGSGIPLYRLGNQDLFGQVGTFEYLQSVYQMTQKDIVSTVRSFLSI